MVAPRGLFVMGNPHIVNLAPRSEHVAVLAGAEIYEALGAQQNITYLSNIQEGAHCVFRDEFVAPLQQNIRKFLKNEANANTGSINAQATRTGNLAEHQLDDPDAPITGELPRSSTADLR